MVKRSTIMSADRYGNPFAENIFLLWPKHLRGEHARGRYLADSRALLVGSTLRRRTNVRLCISEALVILNHVDDGYLIDNNRCVDGT